MILALLLASTLPRYKATVYPFPDPGSWVEVTGISDRGYVVANLWYGWTKYDWSDTIRQTFPVLLMGSRVIKIPAGSYTMALSVNDRSDVLLFDRSSSETFLYRKGVVKQLFPKLPHHEDFEPMFLTNDGLVLGEAFTHEEIVKSMGYYVLVGGKTIPLSSPAKYGFTPSVDSKGSLDVAGLPTMQYFTWKQCRNGVDLGYGVHEDETGEPPHPDDEEYALYREHGRVVPLASLVSEPPAHMTLEEGGIMNAAGTIAASGSVGDKPAIFILKPKASQR